MRIVTKENPTPEDLSRWLATSEGFLQGLTDVDERPTRLTGYQLDHLRDTSKFRAREKARGVGFSFVCAAGRWPRLISGATTPPSSSP
ncbi:MAG: hypothetical protein Fur0037_02530 [Planctomycetota bacterium]